MAYRRHEASEDGPVPDRHLLLDDQRRGRVPQLDRGAFVVGARATEAGDHGLRSGRRWSFFPAEQTGSPGPSSARWAPAMVPGRTDRGRLPAWVAWIGRRRSRMAVTRPHATPMPWGEPMESRRFGAICSPVKNMGRARTGASSADARPRAPPKPRPVRAPQRAARAPPRRCPVRTPPRGPPRGRARHDTTRHDTTRRRPPATFWQRPVISRV